MEFSQPEADPPLAENPLRANFYAPLFYYLKKTLSKLAKKSKKRCPEAPFS
jgi:hypothetical protein